MPDWRRIRGVTLAAAIAATLLPLSAPPLRAQDTEKDAVLAVVDRLFHGMRTRDTAEIRGVFDAQARFVGTRTENGRVVVRTTEPGDFIRAIAGAPANLELIETTYDPVVQIDGDLAQYWAYYTFHRGDEFSHCGVDAMQLLRTSDGWKIVNLADTRRTEGCDRTELKR